MKLKNYIAFIVSFLFWLTSEGQHYTISDPAFVNFLTLNYPSAISGNSIDTIVSKTFTGTFNADMKNINNVDGIQFFTGITVIHLRGNNLTSIPSLDKITGLTHLYLDTNQLTSVPSFKGLTNLYDLRLNDNQLTTLPDMDGMTSLFRFFCNSNQLTALPDMTGMTSLNHFICSDNYITTLPDLSSLTGLQRFLCTNNGITSFDVSSIPNLKEFHANNNKLTQFPTVGNPAQYTEIQIKKNFLTSLPDMTPFQNLTIFNVSNNLLSFDDFIPLSTHNDFALFTITPQKPLGTADTLIKTEGQSAQFNLDFDLSINTNSYTWYRNGTPVQTSSSNILMFDSLLIGQSGTYTCTITNSTPALSGIQLSTVSDLLSVYKCIETNQLVYTLDNSQCLYPKNITVDESSLYNGVHPFTYTLFNQLNAEKESFNSPSLKVKKPGVYDLIITDSLGCQIVLKNKIQVERSLDCEPIIYPDLEGAQASYFISGKGTAKIYSSEGLLLHELMTPGYWDGKDKSGRLVPSGLYQIIVNEGEKIALSVMRN